MDLVVFIHAPAQWSGGSGGSCDGTCVVHISTKLEYDPLTLIGDRGYNFARGWRLGRMPGGMSLNPRILAPDLAAFKSMFC